MHRLFKIVVLIAFIQCTLFNELSVGDDEFCEECSKYFDDVVANSLRQKLTELSPLKFKGIGHCDTCEFSGLENFARTSDKQICITTTESGDVIRHMFVEFPNITGVCDCKFSTSPVDNVRRVLETIADPVIIACTLPQLATNLKHIQFFPKNILPDDVKSLETCFPVIADLAFQKEPFADFKIGANIQNVRISFDLVTKAGGKNAVITNTKDLTDDATPMKHHCEGPAVLTEACRCMVETRYLSHTFFQVVKFVMPCTVEKKDQFTVSDFLNEIACPV